MADTVAAVLACAVEGLTLSADERRFYAARPVAGVTLFARNIPAEYRELRKLTQDLAALSSSFPAAPPPLFAIDQEGGRVSRIRRPDFPDAGPAMQLAGGAGDESALSELRRYGSRVGAALREVGINVNFAPVCDVLTRAENTAIGDRAFGVEPGIAAERAGAFLDGLADVGVAASLKHFPGQGDASVDTHLGGAIVDASWETLKSRELVPFVRLLGRAPMVMISHCIYPALDSKEASRSARVMQDLLRTELGYQGVVVSDDMNMGAIPQDDAAWAEAIVEAVVAGADLILVCRHIERCERAYEALDKARRRSVQVARRLDEAAARVCQLRRSLAR